MQANLLIKYQKQKDDHDGYDLGLLGESFSGFNDVFKDLFDISQVQGELVLRTTQISEGSIDVHNVVQVLINGSPFKDPKDLLDFLQVADDHLFNQASNFFNAFGNAHKTVNDFFKEYEFSSGIVAGTVSGIVSTLMVSYFPKMLKWGGKQKKQLTTRDDEGNSISESQANKLRNMISKGRYKKALKPLSENSISSVKIAAMQKDSFDIVIDENQLEYYLPDDEQILPDFKNGEVINLTGEIRALQSTKGETIKFKVQGIDSRYQLLTAHPEDDKQTDDYKDFYKKQVNVKAEVYRKTMYKKPEIIIRKIELSQEELFEDKQL